MRIPLRNPMGSARPARGVLLATLFAVVTGGVVAGYRVDGSEVSSVAAGDSEKALVIAGDGADWLKVEQTRQLAAGASLSANHLLAGADQGDSTELVMSKEPTDPAPAAPSTVNVPPTEAPTTAAPATKAPITKPPTTKPPTTKPPTTVAPVTTPAEESTITVNPNTTVAPPPTDGSATTAVVDPNAPTVPALPAPETTVPPPTEPPTTTYPDGWVDAGNGVWVPAVLVKIRYCESHDNYTAANRYSTARGAYQFLTTSWASYGHAARYGVKQAHLATPAQQDEAALITWDRSGTNPWKASRSCWS